MSGRGRSRFASGRGLSHVAAVVGSFLIAASLLSIARLFVATPQTASRGALLARRAAPALAPAPTRSSQPSAPLPIDHSRYGEKVRWYAEPQMSRPPEWRVLLLDKTFRNPSNTISKVAACLVATLGIASAMARVCIVMELVSDHSRFSTSSFHHQVLTPGEAVGTLWAQTKSRPMSVASPCGGCPRNHTLVYVISARGEEGRERRKTLKKELEAAGIAKNVSYWPSVDPRTDPKLAQELGKESCPCDESMARALTHRQIYEKVIDEQLTCATIFEDTVSFAPNFQTRLSTVKESVPAFDVLQLGYCGDAPPKDDRKIPKVKYGLPGDAKCFHSYVVSLPGALFLAKANRPLKAAPGDMIDYLKDHLHVRPYVSRTDKSTWNRQMSLPGSFWSLDPALTWQ
ncbi:unnamed protein product [Symbiodinium sp. CCMP2456]|nr:unnamed protein product [Symbiodinium sp. CCMP2456]